MRTPHWGTPGGTRTHATGSGGRCSIQLSYGGVSAYIITRPFKVRRHPMLPGSGGGSKQVSGWFKITAGR